MAAVSTALKGCQKTAVRTQRFQWHPELYPPGLPARDRLARYAQSFTTAELNSSFYRWPPPAAFVQLGPAQARRDSRLGTSSRGSPGWMRVAVEFRHTSWHCEEVFTLLAAHRGPSSSRVQVTFRAA